MTQYFATCDVQGPISVNIVANSLKEVLEQIQVKGQRWIDTLRCDAVTLRMLSLTLVLMMTGTISVLKISVKR